MSIGHITFIHCRYPLGRPPCSQIQGEKFLGDGMVADIHEDLMEMRARKDILEKLFIENGELIECCGSCCHWKSEDGNIGSCEFYRGVAGGLVFENAPCRAWSFDFHTKEWCELFGLIDKQKKKENCKL